uniref:Protein JTB n=1 Tax=Geotrypetes seraphini TaxID=260995 RepID=A0A6P8PAF6_GEOSA|nr:protein JTB [Geotrypetes seraphini]XP_033780769.1 protein JTB [Geotrypetes seraphini]XP_033780770.1 protein JTB [Geotrypetes seraphini]XP_033780771.1 protein JTB [Geotrypetes seraphini]
MKLLLAMSPLVLENILQYIVLCMMVLHMRFAKGSVSDDKMQSESMVVAPTQCWRDEEYVVSKECALCTSFESKTIEECRTTNFIEKINCVHSKREETRSCRSALMERHAFWNFVGSMIGASFLFALVVVFRQRTLDRRALEKVRKQIESI